MLIERDAKLKKLFLGYPLTAHPVGQWCKTIKCKLSYFGPFHDPQTALEKYLAQRDNNQAGRPRALGTLRLIVPRWDRPLSGCAIAFLTEKYHAVQTHELAERTFGQDQRGLRRTSDRKMRRQKNGRRWIKSFNGICVSTEW